MPARLWGKANLYIVFVRWTHIYENMQMPQKFRKGETLFGQNRNGRKAFAWPLEANHHRSVSFFLTVKKTSFYLLPEV